MGYCDLLAHDLGDDPRSEDLAEIRRAADRAAGLTRQLLAFGRKQVLQPVALDLTQVVFTLANLLRRLIGEDIELDIRGPSAPAWVRADASQLEQVIVNLVVNARDAMPKGGRLTIRIASPAETATYFASDRDLPPGDWVLLVVADTGVGMSAEVLPHVFEPFFTTKEVGKGTGLGLATVYGIVSQSGGEIMVESAPSAGTTFRLLLPALPSPEPSVPEPRPPDVVLDGGETVLLIEDEPAVRRLARTVLSGYGYTVLEAASGPLAIDLIRTRDKPVDLVITDMVMPGLNGLETTERIREMMPSVRLLYISGYPDNVLDRHGPLPPGTVFLEKPFTPEELATKVREVLNSRAT